MTAPIQAGTDKIKEANREVTKLLPLSEHDTENCIVDLSQAVELLQAVYEEIAIAGRPSVETIHDHGHFLPQEGTGQLSSRVSY